MINCFDGKYAFLSNFYESPITYEGITYPTNEHFFQAMKTLDINEKKKIAAANTPGQSKRMGRAVTLRSDWETIKSYYMELGLRLKFQNPDLAAKLIATGDEELIEGNPWGDRIWGVYNGEGENRLGKLLMKIRDELKTK